MAIERLVGRLAAGENVGERVTDEFAYAFDPVTCGVGLG